MRVLLCYQSEECTMSDKVTTQQIYDYGRNKIISKELCAGNRIVETELAEEMNTSRTTVRNAMAQLNYAGLLEIKPNYGTFVTKPTMVDMAHTYDVRRALEEEAIRLAIPNVHNEALDKMETILNAQAELEHAYSMNRYIDLNKSFHWVIVRLAGNSILEKYLDEMFNRTAIFLTFYDESATNKGSIATHEHMLNALRARDEKAAIQAVREDITLASDSLIVSDHF